MIRCVCGKTLDCQGSGYNFYGFYRCDCGRVYFQGENGWTFSHREINGTTIKFTTNIPEAKIE